MNRRISKILKETTIWPNKKMFVAECLAEDNTRYECTISPAEKDLFLFFLSAKIKNLDKLYDMIETYGQEQYEDGQFDESYQG